MNWPCTSWLLATYLSEPYDVYSISSLVGASITIWLGLIYAIASVALAVCSAFYSSGSALNYSSMIPSYLSSGAASPFPLLSDTKSGTSLRYMSWETGSSVTRSLWDYLDSPILREYCCAYPNASSVWFDGDCGIWGDTVSYCIASYCSWFSILCLSSVELPLRLLASFCT